MNELHGTLSSTNFSSVSPSLKYIIERLHILSSSDSDNAPDDRADYWEVQDEPKN